MRRVENFVNYLADMDWGWWPVLSLRPPRDKDMDGTLIFKLTCLAGPVTGLLAFLIYSSYAKRVTPLSFVAHLVGGLLVFFLLFTFVCALCWNRRARRLRNAPVA